MEVFLITEEQILELAEQHFSFITEYTATGWVVDTEDLLKFARDIKNKQIGKIIEQLESQIGE